MKLLFDQNLSPRLVTMLSDIYPSSAHLNTLGLDTATDKNIWDYALLNNYTIVTKDSDFSDLGVLFGFPPKVIWIRRGNCSTSNIEILLRTNYTFVEALNTDTIVGLMTLF